jgi:hypothetical protein
MEPYIRSFPVFAQSDDRFCFWNAHVKVGEQKGSARIVAIRFAREIFKYQEVSDNAESNRSFGTTQHSAEHSTKRRGV